ncbi:MAG: glycoside hydrolase family 31 protein [Flavobacteriaceae bacterium]
MRKKVLKSVLWSVAVLSVASYFYWFLPLWGIPFNSQRHGNPPLTPAWALECWLWEDDVNTSEYVDELLAGYREHDIPVRTILLDSPWSLRYNDFKIDSSRYKKPDAWFKDLEDKGYRVVLWMTSMVNSYSKDAKIQDDEPWYNEAMSKGFLAKSSAPNQWWKGKGGFIDYSNPDAMRWWHGLQQHVFDLGIDGWKLDGTATLFWNKLGPVPFFYKKTKSGLMSARTYMDHYYRDEYEYGLTQNPEFVTLSRSIDRGYHPEGFAPIDASAVNWVGDQRHEWLTDEMIKERGAAAKDIALKGVQGFESAIENILKSAELGYNIIGSDIAGFSGKAIPPRLYIRWTQFSTFCGLFLNGGHGERRLWKRTDEELDIIRKYSWLHTELRPYMYHYVITAHEGGRRLQTPLKEGKFHYMFGDDFLIAPIYKDSKSHEVSLPEGKWRYFFGDKKVLQGPTTFERAFSMEEFPVFIKEGAIVPLDIKRAYTNIGDKSSQGFVTILMYPDKHNNFTYYNPDNKEETEISYRREGHTLNVTLQGVRISHILRIQSDSTPKEISLDGRKLGELSWKYNKGSKKIEIKTTAAYKKGAYVIKL